VSSATHVDTTFRTSLNACIIFLLDVGTIRAGLEMARLEPIGSSERASHIFLWPFLGPLSCTL
jgi:hypothetical protein